MCIFLDMDKKQGSGGAAPGALQCIVVVWKLTALTAFRHLKGALPDPNLTGFGMFCSPRSLIDKCNVNSSLQLF